MSAHPILGLEKTEPSLFQGNLKVIKQAQNGEGHI